jgi:hypothetical protein
MIGFVNTHKVIINTSAFSTFTSAQNGGDKKKLKKPWKKKKFKRLI